jgi:hypothetical protein
VFGIAASAKLWKCRKRYVKEWWKPGQMRGYVWLEEPVRNETGWGVDVPLCQISANTSQFRYTHKVGSRSAIRLARIVTEMYRFNLPEVDWFVMGDDDTIFFTDNLVRMLSKYDPSQMHYTGRTRNSPTGWPTAGAGLRSAPRLRERCHGCRMIACTGTASHESCYTSLDCVKYVLSEQEIRRFSEFQPWLWFFCGAGTRNCLEAMTECTLALRSSECPSLRTKASISSTFSVVHWG